MSIIKKIALFANNNDYSKTILNELISKLNKYGYIIDNNDFDLAIAIGGDGSFLRMIKNTSFNSNIYYLGINTGTLGFAQEIYPNEMDKFLEMLSNSNYKVENISVQETKVLTNTNEEKIESINELVIRNSDLKTLYLDLFVNKELLEKFVGDGILISTSFGSSAYNLSFGGSLVYNDLHVLQITPIAPLNSKSYQTLRNSVIVPENRIITLNPCKNKDLLLTIDGVNYYYKDVLKIETYVKKDKIKCLRMTDYDYTKRINEKLLK